jgi:signal transduction histidine kinase
MDGAATTLDAVSAERDGRSFGARACGIAALCATAITVVVAAGGPSADPVLVATARGLTVAVPAAVALHALSRHRDDRFGLLLLALSGATFLTTFAESGDPDLYTLGRVSGFVAEAVLVYVFLAYPSGRLETRADRVLAVAMGVLVLVLFLPRALIAQSFEIPSPFTSCTADCPPNAQFALGHEPGFVGGVMRPAGALLAFVLFMAVSARLYQRLRTATPLGRKILAPVTAVALATSLLTGAGFVARQADVATPAVEVVSWLLALAVPAVTLAAFAGMVRWRLLAGGALERLATCLRTGPDCVTLRRAFAEAFGDPSVRIVFPTASGDRWLDCFGQPMTLPLPADGRGVTEVRHNGSVIAVLAHDPALHGDPELLDAGVAIAAVALDHNRLAAEAEAAMREVRRSRARIAASAERERRRIERDLHDGAQQRLVALRIELELAEDLVRRDADHGVERLRKFGGDVDDALDEIRRLAHGTYPPMLSDRGLVEALRAATAGSSLAVELDVHDVGRYPPEVESAVYFCVRESLQNTLKHATGARRLRVSLDGSARDELSFSVRDDGAGARGGRIRAGAGITNMKDRLAAVGGDVWLRSTPGVGTVVRGRVSTARLTDGTPASRR